MASSTPKLRVLVCDELAPDAAAILEQSGFALETRLGLGEAALVDAVRGVHAIVVRSATKLTRRVLEAARELRVIGRAGVGVDNIDCEAATERGVVVMNTPDGNTISAAELAIALVCALARHVPRADKAARSGWKKKGLMGTELTGKTLGVIGLGRIGRAVAIRAQGLQMRVVAHDPFLANAEASPVHGVELMELDELLRASDFVTLHVPANDATRNLLSREKLALLKRGARLVNAARGGLVDETAVIEALERGDLRGAAFDVLAEEPPSPNHPLLSRDDVILTPHLGASSDEAQQNVAVEIARQIAEFLEHGVARNAVNAPTADAETLRAVAPWVVLAEKLGSFLAQRAVEPIRTVELAIEGELARFDPSHVRLALLVGILRHQSRDAVNFVNAPRLAKERGLRLSERVDPEPNRVAGSIEVRATIAGGSGDRGGEWLAVGALFGNRGRLTRIDELHVDLELAGTLLVTRHADRPGVVGTVGTLLGRQGVNIRRIELGPLAKGGRALGFWSLDQEPSDAALRELANVPGIEKVELLRL